MSNDSQCCSCGSDSGCCSDQIEKKTIIIDFLYLDLSVCERCQGTESNLEEAIREVSGVLNASGYDVQLNKINVTTAALAEQYEFVSSPTIRINGNDIVLEVMETPCQSCGDLCGDDVECRSWMYEGKEYSEPPKGMIINAILKAVYGTPAPAPESGSKYVLPQNLKVFFDGLNKESDEK